MSRVPGTTHARQLDRSFQISQDLAAFGVLATIQVTLILAITVIAIALPAIQQDLGLRTGQLVLVSAGYGLAFSGLLLLGSRLGDLMGRRTALTTGVAGFGLASAAAGISSDFVTLFLARLAQGTGAALAAPAAMALLESVFPDRDRHARAVALWGGLAPIGAPTGILLSGVAVTLASWRWAFAVPAAVAAVAVVASRRLLPEGTRPSASRIDVPGALLATTGIASLSYGLVTAGDHGWASTGAALPLVAGVGALAGFLAVEARVRAPLVPLPFLRSPHRAIALATVMVVAAGHASIGFFLALYFQQIRDMSAIATTAAFLPFLLPLPLAGMVASRLVARAPAHSIAAGGLGLGAAGLLLIGQMGIDTPYAGPLLAGLLMFPTGAALTFSGATVLAVRGVEPARAGLAGGLVNTAVELGPTVGLAVLVSLAGTRATQLLGAGHSRAAATAEGYAHALTVAGVAFAVAAAGLGAVGHRLPTKPSVRQPEENPYDRTIP